MSAPVKCQCPGFQMYWDEPDQLPCRRPVTQEDLLCDHCRELDCKTVTSVEIKWQRMHSMDVRRAESLKVSS